MLDDLAYIHKIDKSDALGIAIKEPDQLDYAFNLNLKTFSNIQNVVYAGMGGSALAASLSLSWPGYKLPFEVIRNYDLPAYVNGQTLCIIASYSGNTEETLSALTQAEQKRAQIVIIASGGKLKAQAEEKGYPIAVIPVAKQPRYAVFYNFKALYQIITSIGVATNEDNEAINRAAEFLRGQVQLWKPDIPTKDNLAKQIALDALGKSVVIYGGPLLAPAAYKWKISFNENAKQVAWTGVYSEFNHNEFIGWSNQPVDKPYCIIDLRSQFEHPRISQRFVLSSKLLSGKRPSPIVVDASGNNLLEHLLYSVLLGDFVTLYCSIAAGTDPEPVDLVEKFKVMLAQESVND
jgi:glucose/mannose-6-phosphate isomerase